MNLTVSSDVGNRLKLCRAKLPKLKSVEPALTGGGTPKGVPVTTSPEVGNSGTCPRVVHYSAEPYQLPDLTYGDTACPRFGMFLVWIMTFPEPVNLFTRPSPVINPNVPDAISIL